MQNVVTRVAGIIEEWRDGAIVHMGLRIFSHLIFRVILLSFSTERASTNRRFKDREEKGRSHARLRFITTRGRLMLLAGFE